MSPNAAIYSVLHAQARAAAKAPGVYALYKSKNGNANACPAPDGLDLIHALFLT